MLNGNRGAHVLSTRRLSTIPIDTHRRLLVPILPTQSYQGSSCGQRVVMWATRQQSFYVGSFAYSV